MESRKKFKFYSSFLVGIGKLNRGFWGEWCDGINYLLFIYSCLEIEGGWNLKTIKQYVGQTFQEHGSLLRKLSCEAYGSYTF